MSARVKLRNQGGSYFAAPKNDIEFISTGCKRLDLALGGGWVEGRVANIVGDKSTGKTLLMIEAAANFVAKYPRGIVYYREAEAAFDKTYAAALGMPTDHVKFGDAALETVEDFFEDLNKVCDKAKGPTLYVLDSLDALSDRGEMQRGMDEGSFGAAKAKMLSQMFRRVIRKLEDKRVTLLIVSQIRDNIGVVYGRKFKRSGGKALDFYASHVVYLAQRGKLYKTIRKVKRAIGVEVRAMVDKNKISLPFREADFNILFGYGVDDAQASAAWLKQVGRLADAKLKPDDLGNLDKLDAAQIAKLQKATENVWYEIETSFIPKRRKYGG